MKRDGQSRQQKSRTRPTGAGAGVSKTAPSKKVTPPGGSPTSPTMPAAGEDGGQPTVDPISEASTGGPPRGKEFKKVSVSREQAPPESKRLRVTQETNLGRLSKAISLGRLNASPRPPQRTQNPSFVSSLGPPLKRRPTIELEALSVRSGRLSVPAGAAS
jgi:hypothetical protein